MATILSIQPHIIIVIFPPCKSLCVWEKYLQSPRKESGEVARERAELICMSAPLSRQRPAERGLEARGRFLVQLFKDCWLASSCVGAGTWEQAVHIPPSDCSWWNTHVLLSSQHLAHASFSDPSHSNVLWPTLACQTWAGLRSDTDGFISDWT